MNTTKNKTTIININFTSFTGNRLEVLVSKDGVRDCKHLELNITELPLHKYGIYDFRDIACQLSGYLDLKLTKSQVNLLTARLFKAAQSFIIGK